MNLDLDQGVVATCHEAAQKIAADIDIQIVGKTTVSVERATARLMGVAGSVDGIPAANILTQEPSVRKDLGRGIATVGALWSLPGESPTSNATERLGRIAARLAKRKQLREGLGTEKGTLSYVLTATGDVDEDVTHALAVAEAGGDIIAVIRSTAQSLLDYVPEGATHEGYGGTFATQENFRIMRQALDEWSEKNSRYVRLSSFCSGLCMPEIAAIGAMEGLDNMVNDGLYGCLYRDINMQRTLIDQRFSRMINGWAGIVINTGEDNYLRTADALDAAPSVTASQFINYYLARSSGVPDEQIGLGDAFEINPDFPNSLLYQIAQALLTRELWPDCPVKYMPPTRFMDGNLYRTHANDAMFNLVTILTRQSIQTIGVPTEGLHTPHIHDRVFGLQNVNYTQTAARNLGDELELRKDGVIEARARWVIEQALAMLERIADIGLYAAIERGFFGDVKRKQNSGRGLEGIIEKATDYFNPAEEAMSMSLDIHTTA
jgi:beta-lysine 5,6-aminomutase alpha subunit